MRLGFVSQHFESGDGGPGTISTGVGDPGGRSYGIYQYVANTLYEYLNTAYFKFPGEVGSTAFDVLWTKAAEVNPDEFILDQQVYAVRRFFLPIVLFAKGLSFETQDARIQEALFSAAIQHGGVRQIVTSAWKVQAKNASKQIHALYQARSSYVVNLKLSAVIQKALLARYKLEEEMVQNLPAEIRYREFSEPQSLHSPILTPPIRT